MKRRLSPRIKNRIKLLKSMGSRNYRIGNKGNLIIKKGNYNEIIYNEE